MKTLDERIKAIKEDAENKIKEEQLKENLTLQGLPVKSCYLSFSNKMHYNFECNTFKEAQRVKTWIEANDTLQNYVLKFASKDDIQTFSPFVLNFENMDHEGRPLKNSVRIQAEGLNGEYWIDLKSPQMYHNDILASDRKQLKHLGYGRYLAKNIHYLDIYGQVKYYGDTVKNYCRYEEDREEFEFTIFNGHVKEFIYLMKEHNENN
jgi:hypothetical protein